MEMVYVEVNGRYSLWMPDHRAERPEWYSDEGWELQRMLSMEANLGPSDTLFYVGAEEGEMAAIAQMWGVEVVLFEPNQKVWGNISAIWEANGLDYPVFYQGFASDKDFVPDSFEQMPWEEMSSLEAVKAHGFSELWSDEGQVPHYTIDRVVAETGVFPTALSIDVEGSEWSVLRGAEYVLDEFRPSIWLSLHPQMMLDHYGEDSDALRDWICGFGYIETFLDAQHETHYLYEGV